MAIDIKEILARGGKAQATGEREYTRYFQAVVPDEDLPVTEVDISLATGCPRRYDPVGPQDQGARLTELEVVESGSVNLWKITARYTTQYGDEAVNNEPNPLLRPAVWSYQSVKTTRVDGYDCAGNAYQTAAGEPFASPPVTPYAVSRWTVQRNLSWWNDTVTESYLYTVNDDAWKGKDKYAVLCDGVTAQEQWENDFHFWTLTYTFLVDSRRLWQPVYIPNKGYRYLDDYGAEQTSDTLVWLNADGKKWTAGDPVEEGYLEYYPFNEAGFSAFPI